MPHCRVARGEESLITSNNLVNAIGFRVTHSRVIYFGTTTSFAISDCVDQGESFFAPEGVSLNEGAHSLRVATNNCY